MTDDPGYPGSARVTMATPTDLLWRVEEIRHLISRHFPVQDVWFDGGRPAFTIQRPRDVRPGFAALRAQLEPMGYLPALRRRRGVDLVVLLSAPPPLRTRWEVNLALFVATLGTTFYAGYLQVLPLVRGGLLESAIGGALAFALPLVAILLTHEMGHKVASLARGIRASLPYFIPMVPPVGTMGALIVTRSPAPDRDSLMDLGASGPLAGFLVAIPILIYGIRHSFVLEPLAGTFISFPDPLLVRWLTTLLLRVPEGMVVLGHPMFWAGWYGLLVTSLNLLPASMLDGGHAVRAAFGPVRHRQISFLGILIALAFGYLPMAVLIYLFIPRGHPGPLDDLTPLSPSRVVVALALVALFVLSAVPLWTIWSP